MTGFNVVRIVSSPARGRVDVVVLALLSALLLVGVIVGAFVLVNSRRERALAALTPHALRIPVVTTYDTAQVARVIQPRARVSSNGYATLVVETDRTIRLYSGGATPVERLSIRPGAVLAVDDARIGSGPRTMRGLRLVLTGPTGPLDLGLGVMRERSMRSIAAADLDDLIPALRTRLGVTADSALEAERSPDGQERNGS